MRFETGSRDKNPVYDNIFHEKSVCKIKNSKNVKELKFSLIEISFEIFEEKYSY